MTTISIIMEAGDIPEGTVVRKPTGTKEYLMRRNGLQVYSHDYSSLTADGDRVKVYGIGLLHMTCAESIELLGSHQRLAIDFQAYRDVESFLGRINDDV